MINWFSRRNRFEKKEIRDVLGISDKYYSHWATGVRKPNKTNAKLLVVWAKKNTPHDIPSFKKGAKK